MSKCTAFVACCLFLLNTASAQSPQSFSYQAVIRDQSFEVLASQDVTIRLRLLEDSPEGLEAYSEEHEVTTTPIGLVNLAVGAGDMLAGEFSAIDWANHAFFLELLVDLGDGDFIVMGR